MNKVGIIPITTRYCIYTQQIGFVVLWTRPSLNNILSRSSAELDKIYKRYLSPCKKNIDSITKPFELL